jgi:poly(A) polymerase
MKTHHSAIVLIPPESVWEPIQAIRRRYDRNLRRWMPHVTLLYPFRSVVEFETAAALVGQAIAKATPFIVRLAAPRWFPHGRSFTLWLDPTPHEPLVSLQARLVEAFPDCDETSRYAGGFTPHLSIGQASTRAELEARLAEIQAAWRAVTFEASEVALIHREGDRPFVVGRTVPFGGGDSHD